VQGERVKALGRLDRNGRQGPTEHQKIERRKKGSAQDSELTLRRRGLVALNKYRDELEASRRKGVIPDQIAGAKHQHFRRT